MRRRPTILLGTALLGGVLLAGGCPAPGDDGAAPGASGARSSAPSASASRVKPKPPTPAAAPPDAERGRQMYEVYCAFCHGERGEGYAADEAPKLANDDFLALATDTYLRETILRGRPGTTMSAWGKPHGGPLERADALDIVAYLRTWQSSSSEDVHARTLSGDAKRGEPVYQQHCQSCHGERGAGGRYAQLSNPELLRLASDGFLATTIERGRRGTPMQGFAGVLQPREVDDLVALIKSYKQRPEEALDLPPKPGGLVDVVIQPKGPQPAFDPKADFVKCDDVKKELDRGATMIIADARAAGDYAREHIAGAISVPFYEVEAYAKQIPKDRYILTYCACPHAASVKLRDKLRKLGYTRVAVLDEGIGYWKNKGYPLKAGAKP
jgi:cytochrome c oxidase cbb3-type subunit 3/ubiquinol-cytochrome c reductase cytochrome c subunit